MSSDIWLSLSSSERSLLREALSAYQPSNKQKVQRLLEKLERKAPLPATIIRVEGGFVDIEGNPNPILIYDYDCDGCDELSSDREGRSCIVSEHAPSA